MEVFLGNFRLESDIVALIDLLATDHIYRFQSLQTGAELCQTNLPKEEDMLVRYKGGNIELTICFFPFVEAGEVSKPVASGIVILKLVVLALFVAESSS